LGKEQSAASRRVATDEPTVDRRGEGAAEQGDEAAEARAELERGVVGDLFRGQVAGVGVNRDRTPRSLSPMLGGTT